MDILVFSIIVFITAFFAGYYLTPKIRGLMLTKNLTAEPDHRSSHEKPTPNLGGIAFYVILMLSFYFISPYDPSDIVISLIPGLTILFIVGLKDDLMILAPLTKLLAQLAAVTLFVFHYWEKIRLPQPIVPTILLR